ncbi:MAG: phosphodiester glycosidase family protein [Patescibacteria group bacterium]
MKFLWVFLILAVLTVGSFFVFKNVATRKVVEQISQTLSPKLTDKIVAVSGSVVIIQGEETRTLNFDTEEELIEGDQITTDSKGLATITYKSGSIVRINGDSDVVFKSEVSLFQNSGTIFIRFKKLIGVQETFEVESENMVASVRGTAFASIIKKGFDPKILVTDHEVEVLAKGSNTKKLVVKGQQATVSKTKKTVTVGKQILSKIEKDWLLFNDQSDGIATPSATPKATAKASPVATASGTPLATKAPISYQTVMSGAGYSKGYVKTEKGDYLLSCMGAKVGTFRTVTDSASDSDCKDNCPVLPLADYAKRNNGFAAINGMYFCPADYASCAGKTNTFDTLFFNSRTKNYMNSSNNVYSSIPFFVVNGDGSPRFIGQSSQWGRDTGIQAGTAGNPMLIQGGNIAAVEGNLDEKQRTVKSNRGAIVQKGDTLYLCITGGATVLDSALVYKTLAVDNAINIDGGGSSALWINGSYVYGPGRQIPTAIIFAR